MTRKLLIAVLVFGLAGASALAAENSGFFAGVGVGYTSQEIDVSTDNFKDNSTAWKVFVGYHPMKFLGFEAGYIDFGDSKGDVDLGLGSEEIKVSPTGYNLDLVGTIPLGEIFEIYGKAGYLWWDAKADASSFSDKSSGSDWLYGLGGKVIIGKKLGIRLEYENFQIEDTKNFYLISAGAEWRF